jgi:hypothetical protein
MKGDTMRLLKRGDRVHIKSGTTARFGSISEDQVLGDHVVWLSFDGDDPVALDFGRRTLWRSEVSPIRPADSLATPIANLTRGTWT